MNLQLNDSVNFPAMLNALIQKLPSYKIELKKNPIAGFEYIQVTKSAYVGIWIRVFPKKEPHHAHQDHSFNNGQSPSRRIDRYADRFRRSNKTKK